MAKGEWHAEAGLTRREAPPGADHDAAQASSGSRAAGRR